MAALPQTFLTRGEGCKEAPRAYACQARAPEPSAHTVRPQSRNPLTFSAAEPPAPWPSFGYDKSRTGSGGFGDPQTCPSLHGGAAHGPRPWPWCGAWDLRADTAWHTPGRTAPAGAGRAAGHPSIPGWHTSTARTWTPRCAERCLSACGPRSIRPGPGCSIPGADTASGAFVPSGYHLRAKQKAPGPTRPAIAVHVAQALWHRHWLIFTMDSFPQSLQ